MAKKRARRFEPRWGGVSHSAPVEEAKEAAIEVDTYLICSLNELREKLTQLRSKWEQDDAVAEAIIRELPEGVSLAVQCLLYRDSWYLLELYLEYLKQAPRDGARAPKASADAPMTPKLFSEFLFPR